MKRIVLFAIAVWGIFACSESFRSDTRNEGEVVSVVQSIDSPSAKLSEYWYQGKAEITSYQLAQNRYQDVHPGEAIMIFVTEDFLVDKQVKNERYQNPNTTSVLKNNQLRKFPTGIYDYQMMTSVFTPANPNEYPYSLKVTSSAQEWCGQAFMQVNYKDKHYVMQLNSYFEGEGDQSQKAELAILEDEIYNRIRINPANLPKGEIAIYPSSMVLRLLHLPFKPVQAEATTNVYTGHDIVGDELSVYQITFPSLGRTLEIVYETKAPYEIAGWVDAYPSVFDRKVRKTIAQRKKTVLAPYWQQNGLSDMKLREALELD